jgi:hypothetical protein
MTNRHTEFKFLATVFHQLLPLKRRHVVGLYFTKIYPNKSSNFSGVTIHFRTPWVTYMALGSLPLLTIRLLSLPCCSYVLCEIRGVSSGWPPLAWGSYEISSEFVQQSSVETCWQTGDQTRSDPYAFILCTLCKWRKSCCRATKRHWE